MGVTYKFKGGKFVPRTAEEERRYTEYFTTATDYPKPRKIPKKTEPFIQITMKQLDRLIPLLSKSPEVSIFFVLCHESFRHRGAAFVWPTDKLAKIGGFKPRTQRRVILYLEKVGLITVRRVHKKPPIVQILTVR
jgi:hypothetical protein